MKYTIHVNLILSEHIPVLRPASGAAGYTLPLNKWRTMVPCVQTSTQLGIIMLIALEINATGVAYGNKEQFTKLLVGKKIYIFSISTKLFNTISHFQR